MLIFMMITIVVFSFSFGIRILHREPVYAAYQTIHRNRKTYIIITARYIIV